MRLGATRIAITRGDKFFRQELATDLSRKIHSLIVPALQTEGIVINAEKDLRINRVNITGIDIRFTRLWTKAGQNPGEDEAIISRNIAERLNIQSGDEILLKIRKPGRAPQNAPFVAEKQPSVSLRFKVIGIADDRNLGRFSLKKNQAAPFNVFISLDQMARKLDLAGLSNMLLIAGEEDTKPDPVITDSLIKAVWKTEDAGINIHKIGETSEYEITSDRIFIDDKTSEAILNTIPGGNKIFTYLANSISFKNRSAPYSFITAADTGFLRQSPGPGEIIINRWLADDLEVKPGDLLKLRFYRMGPLRTLKEIGVSFSVKSIVPMNSSLEDRTLMPQFPGMSEAGSCRNWETGAPVDLKKIRDKDEKYWNDWRGTPKGFISLTVGQSLWDNPFGRYSAFRFKAKEGDLAVIGSGIMKKLTPAGMEFVIVPVFAEGKLAAGNSTDFGSLFLSLSVFLILAGLLLTALIFSLHARTRFAETRIMSAIGFRKKMIASIFLRETLPVTIAGSITGVFSSIGYTYLLLLGLKTLWQEAVGTTMLAIHLEPLTLLTGFITGMVISLMVLLLAIYRNLYKPVSLLLKESDLPTFSGRQQNAGISLFLSILFLIISTGLIIYPLLISQTSMPILFLISGGTMLAALVAFANFMLLRMTGKSMAHPLSLKSLIVKNAGLKRSRSLAVITLMALGTFIIIITGANRRTFRGTETDRGSGTGGFLFWAETSFPVQYDLNSQQGRKAFSLEDESYLKDVRFVQMQSLAGDDASCLNLNQVSNPVIIAVNSALFDRLGAFSFSQFDSSADNAHPWLVLNKAPAPGVINVFADQTVITWGLNKSIGDTLDYLDESGKILKLVLKGGLDNSIFQGNLLVSDSLFRIYYPSAGGSRLMLVDGPYGKRKEIRERLEALLLDYGLMLSPASERLADFNAVENTYLSVFMLLGGLGIILGTIGLGIILFRNLYERRSEIAIYQALGFTRTTVFRLLAAEYLSLFIAGMTAGVISALAGIMPSLISPSFHTPGVFLILISAVIMINGFIWIFLLTGKATKTDLIGILKEE